MKLLEMVDGLMSSRCRYPFLPSYKLQLSHYLPHSTSLNLTFWSRGILKIGLIHKIYLSRSILVYIFNLVLLLIYNVSLWNWPCIVLSYDSYVSFFYCFWPYEPRSNALETMVLCFVSACFLRVPSCVPILIPSMGINTVTSNMYGLAPDSQP